MLKKGEVLHDMRFVSKRAEHQPNSEEGKISPKYGTKTPCRPECTDSENKERETE